MKNYHAGRRWRPEDRHLGRRTHGHGPSWKGVCWSGSHPVSPTARLVKTHRPAGPRCPAPHPHLHAGHVPNLVLQEVHVPVEQGVGRGEHAHGLHAGAALQLALHRHVGEAGQAEEGPLPEVAATGQVRSVAQNPSDTFPFSPAFSFEGQSPRREVTIRGLHEKAQPREPLL